MQVLQERELEEVNGGIAGLVVAGIIVGGIALVGLAVGIYKGYKAAEHDAAKK